MADEPPISTQFTTGFFDAAARAAGETTPDEATVSAANASLDSAFVNRLHTALGFGRFDLWPRLSQALQILQRVHATSSDIEQWSRLCQQGALLYLRSTLLQEGLVPHFEWPDGATPRTCERFGEAFATFAHYDLRLQDLSLYNIWVPISHADAEPLLLFAADASFDGAWREPSFKARQLQPHEAQCGSWYYFHGLMTGQALIFPGDGGSGQRGLFHASAWAKDAQWATSSEGSRSSFDVRELVKHAPTEGDAAAARERQERECEAWQVAVDEAMAVDVARRRRVVR